jgi:flagellar biogenesis protein FliO
MLLAGILILCVALIVFSIWILDRNIKREIKHDR